MPNPYIDAGNNVVLPLESVDGDQLTVHPGESGIRSDVIFQDRSTGSEERSVSICLPIAGPVI